MRAREYHESTKHSPASVGRGGHRLDFDNKPHPFKDYLDLDPIPLPEPAPDTGLPTTAALAGAHGDYKPLDLPEVARLLGYGAGNLRKKVRGHGDTAYFRTYACAGALYPIEVYLCAAAVDGIEPGVYHFHPLERSLRRLRGGDPRHYLARAAPSRPSVASSPATVVLSGIPWRTTWKYQARGYRHLFWDSGMILANLLALASSGGHETEVVLGFADDETDRLLGIGHRDGLGEMSLALVTLGEGADPVAPAAKLPAPVEHRVRPLSASEVEYPDIFEVHDATALTVDEAARWGAEPPSPPAGLSEEGRCRRGLEETILRRGSTRAFRRDAIEEPVLREALERAFATIPGDWDGPLTEANVIVNSVGELDPGAYRYHDGDLELLEKGVFRDHASYLCLGQHLGGDAAATVFLTCDLDGALDRLGERAYRAAQLEAAIAGGRIYLTAFACGTGATGLTFFDDEVRRFFDTTSEPMLVVALGNRDSSRYLM